MNRAPTPSNTLAAATMIRYLQDVPSNVGELAQACGLCLSTTRRFVLALHRVGAIHVAAWEPDSVGRATTKVYAFGEGPDMAKPAPRITALRRLRRMRAKQVQIQNALAGV